MIVSTFVQQLKAAGLGDLFGMRAALRELLPTVSDGEELAERLRERSLLTPFQIHFLLAGKGRILRLGPYRLVKRLCRGRTAHTFKAMHVRIRRPTVLRIPTPLGAANQELQERTREATRKHAQLCHTNVLTAVDAVETSNRYVPAFEYVFGIPLPELLLRTGPLPIPLACNFARQIACGLQHVREHGMADYLLRPGNVLVTGKKSRDGIDVRLVKLRGIGVDEQWEDVRDFEHLFLKAPSASPRGGQDHSFPPPAQASTDVACIISLIEWMTDQTLAAFPPLLAQKLLESHSAGMQPGALLGLAAFLEPLGNAPAALTAAQFTHIPCGA